MIVLKFGGTSVGKPERMKKVAELVLGTPGKKIVVLSALSGTTNTLVSIGEKLLTGQSAEPLIADLENHYNNFVDTLYETDTFRQRGRSLVNRFFVFIRMLAGSAFDDKSNRELLAQGELMSTEMFHEHLQERGITSSRLLPALQFMSIDENDEPELEKIATRLTPLLSDLKEGDIVVTQGYICRNHRSEIDNLKRGGSDYTASLIGAAIKADEVQIWTDIDGMHNNDPRIVERTVPISELTFDEASELAYFGAKILHPSTIVPAQKYNVPVRLKNTMDEAAPGTIISNKATSSTFKAVAAKDGIVAIRIKSSRMLLAYGFLVRVFDVFQRYKTPIDMITTSEVAVSLTIDNLTHLDKIVGELEKFGSIEVDRDQTIICIVGHRISTQTGILNRIFDSLKDVPVRMVSYGGSTNNISILVANADKNQALRNLNSGLFGL